MNGRRGVCWNKKNKRWQAAINSSGKYLYLGSFTNEDEAARQFDRAAIKLRGKKAKLNFEYAGLYWLRMGCTWGVLRATCVAPRGWINLSQGLDPLRPEKN
jgi:hypothetical protein